MTRRTIFRQITLLMRDARGRFTRIRVLTTRARRTRAARRRAVVVAVQLALF